VQNWKRWPIKVICEMSDWFIINLAAGILIKSLLERNVIGFSQARFVQVMTWCFAPERGGVDNELVEKIHRLSDEHKMAKEGVKGNSAA
jgi:hypothetical protein